MFFSYWKWYVIRYGHDFMIIEMQWRAQTFIGAGAQEKKKGHLLSRRGGLAVAHVRSVRAPKLCAKICRIMADFVSFFSVFGYSFHLSLILVIIREHCF